MTKGVFRSKERLGAMWHTWSVVMGVLLHMCLWLLVFLVSPSRCGPEIRLVSRNCTVQRMLHHCLYTVFSFTLPPTCISGESTDARATTHIDEVKPREVAPSKSDDDSAMKALEDRRARYKSLFSKPKFAPIDINALTKSTTVRRKIQCEFLCSMWILSNAVYS